MKAKEEKVVSTNKKTLTSNTTKQTKPEKETKPAEKPVKKAASTKTSNAKVNEKPTKTTEKSMGIYRVVFDKVNRRWQIKRDGAERVITSYLTKEEALAKVKKLSENFDVGFVVHKKDGKFQKKTK